ncbi:MAG TPA: hypothetical protein GX706_01010 [Candidatus Moranbacteria bacterium]|nr:hypothetical protein [Candidatus Moranbacteria bacterium]
MANVLNNFLSTGRKKLEPEEVKVFYFDYSGFRKLLSKVEVLIMVDLSIIKEDCLGEVLRQVKTKIPPMEEKWSIQIMAVHGAAIEF